MADLSLQQYEKALDTLDQSLKLYNNSAPDSEEQKAFRDSCIQRFEFCVELAWKVTKKVMGTSSSAPKTVIREMAQDGLISFPEKWLNFVDARNKSSHTYIVYPCFHAKKANNSCYSCARQRLTTFATEFIVTGLNLSLWRSAPDFWSSF